MGFPDAHGIAQQALISLACTRVKCARLISCTLLGTAFVSLVEGRVPRPLCPANRRTGRGARTVDYLVSRLPHRDIHSWWGLPGHAVNEERP